MFSGFDFGTSNCAIGVVRNSEAELIPIDRGKVFMPSVLYALQRELICEHTALGMPRHKYRHEYLQLRQHQLKQAQEIRRVEDIQLEEQRLFFGQDAFEQYFDYPEEGYFVKSVKSYLGATGLQEKAVQFFEDIVTAMMLEIKQRAEHNLENSIEHTVIGRPINFQGLYPEESNRRALDILTVSAKRAGFKSVEFAYEPLAAGLYFEEQMKEDKTVLIVDVGGGTTDCSMLRMGPNYRNDLDRSNSVLGHSGDRVGGNDFDIQLAGNVFMPLFGMNSLFKDGTAVPSQLFWQAVRTNNIADQTVFNSKQSGFYLQQYLRDSATPHILSRFIKLRDKQQNHHIVKMAEQSKIALSDNESHQTDFNFIEDSLIVDVTRMQFSRAVKREISIILKLVDEAILQASERPDLVYITGGAAKSQLIRKALEQKLTNIDVVDGDHFGSVAKGLTIWSQRVFS